jgi:hypothetical protein
VTCSVCRPICCQLLFGSETWALTNKQADWLQVVHSTCWRQVLNVHCADRHSLQQVWSECGIISFAAHLAAHRLRWLGHVLRMCNGRHPHQVLFSLEHDAGAAPQGRPTSAGKRVSTGSGGSAGSEPVSGTDMHDLEGV